MADCNVTPEMASRTVLDREEREPWTSLFNLTADGDDTALWTRRLGSPWNSLANGVVARRWLRPPGALTFVVYTVTGAGPAGYSAGENLLVPHDHFVVLEMAAYQLAARRHIPLGARALLRLYLAAACDLVELAATRGWSPAALLADYDAGTQVLAALCRNGAP